MAREDYEQSKILLLKLHELNAEGRDQTDEADQIREAMDLPARGLTPLERARLKGLSADLYMLTGEEVKTHASRSITPADFFTMWNANDWDGVLHALRQDNFHFEQQDQVAGVRAVCWEEFGDYDVSLLFSEYAVKLNPSFLMYRATVLLNRIRLGKELDMTTLAEVLRNHKQISNDFANALHEDILKGSFSQLRLLQPA